MMVQALDIVNASKREFAEWFEERLRELRGRSASEIPAHSVPEGFRPASVLLPFWRNAESVYTAFTLRTQHLSSHKGQIAFPGGREDPSDPSPMHTALREAREELALPAEDVEVLARLDDAWSIHRYLVRPYVGWLPGEPAMQRQEAEVERIIVADVQRLMGPEVYRRERVSRNGQRFHMHYFDYDGDVVWGLTGSILYGLFQLVRGEDIEPESAGPSTLARFVSMGGLK